MKDKQASTLLDGSGCGYWAHTGQEYLQLNNRQTINFIAHNVQHMDYEFQRMQSCCHRYGLVVMFLGHGGITARALSFRALKITLLAYFQHIQALVNGIVYTV